ncbi:hypothetical protein DEJ23_02235 [Curtobacterium sp. MCSS17_008]|uniref:DUF4192 family protein n=1 Tax=Curtobacterium sp. MCSS17_008 TaxID=2175647 RepID=UPI000DA9F918|nr:DUF4192 family protein [Curtobacterium sp. MCSS17_008]PZF59845.1 hypothetical protein DEJ23_02235 [Curtobacterium sp. MCSS17_008]
MTSTRHGHPATPMRYPREIAAAVTLRAACAALVAPPPAGASADQLDRRRAVAVVTACGALATRFAMVGFLADRRGPDPREVVPFDPFRDPTPAALGGSGPEPDRARLRLAGDRCATAWRAWRTDGGPSGDVAIGAAGALALGSWCAWAVGSAARAEVRARHALDTRPDDPFAWLVLRAVRSGYGPAW